MHALGWPLAWAWRCVAEQRRRRFDQHRAGAASVSMPVVSIGGIEVGGSGKSPVTAYVLKRLLSMGAEPGLLTRGYARRSRGLVVRHRHEAACADRIGDEAAMIVEAGLNVPVAAVARRILGAQALIALGCDAIVLDDGFVHRALQRELDIVVLSSSLSPDDVAFVPVGRLRESPKALARAHLLWWHDKGGAKPDALWQTRWLQAHAPGVPVVRSRAWLDECLDCFGQSHRLHARRLVAACGVAKPQTFATALSAAGAQVVGSLAFGDHVPGNPRRLRQATQLAMRHQAEAIVVTAKDWPSWRPLAAKSDLPLWVAPQRFSLSLGDAERVDRLLYGAMRRS